MKTIRNKIIRNKIIEKMEEKREVLPLPSFEWEDLTEKSSLGIGMLPDWLVPDFDSFWELHPEEFAEVIIMGKKVKTPRWQQSYLRDYNFSGMNHEAKPLPDILSIFLLMINAFKWGEFNGVLVNWYENGHHYIGAHSDDERDIVPGSPIVTVTLGSERKFRIRMKKGKNIVKEILIPNRMIVVMNKSFQKEFTHEIVKISGKRGETVDRRISLTFRQFKN